MHRPRGTRAGLSLEIVSRDALWILDHEGLDALSMRRLAKRLDVAPNAIYSYVPDRLSLIDALLDLVLRDVVVPQEGKWDTRLEKLMLRIWRALMKRPELVPHYFSRRELGPEAMRLGGAALELLREGGLGEERAGQAMRSLMIYAIGSAAIRLPAPPSKSVAGSRSQQVAAVQERSERDFHAGLRWFTKGLLKG